MKSFAVIGLGRFGTNLALTLAKNDNQVLVIDKSASKVQKVSDMVSESVIGDPTDVEVLKAADVKSYDYIIVCLSENMEDSILITLELKQIGAKMVVVRAISEMHKKVLEKVGADRIVFPELDMGERLAYKLLNTNLIEFIEVSEEYSIVEIPVPKKWINKSINELNIRKVFGLNVLAVHDIKSDELVMKITPAYVFGENQIVVILGKNEDIAQINK